MSRVLLLPEPSGNKPALRREAQQGGNKSSCRLFLSKSSPGTLFARRLLVPQPDAENTAAVHLRLGTCWLILQGQEKGRGKEIEVLDSLSLPALCRRRSLRPRPWPPNHHLFSVSASLLFLVISLSEHLGQPRGRGWCGGVGDGQELPSRGLQSKAEEKQLRGPLPSSGDPRPDILSGDTSFQSVHLCWLSCLLAFDTTVEARTCLQAA